MVSMIDDINSYADSTMTCLELQSFKKVKTNQDNYHYYMFVNESLCKLGQAAVAVLL